MKEKPSGFRPFVPGQKKENKDGNKSNDSQTKKKNKRTATSKKPAVNSFAPPESIEERQKSLAQSVLLKEKEVVDEEILLQPVIPTTAPTSQRTTAYLSDRFEILFIILLFILSTFSIIATRDGVGMAWDEAYYINASQKTLQWTSHLLSGEKKVRNGATLDAYWDAYELEPRGHPSITRLLTASGLITASPDQAPLNAIRLPIAICYGLTLVMLYLLARRFYGRITGWITVLAYFCMPRVFGHAHFALTETPMVLFSILTIYAFVRGLELKRWALATGIFFGLAMATKANALLLPAILLPWAFLFHRKQSAGNIYAMIFLAPITMILVWPWMWDKTIIHFLKYLLWNFDHKQSMVLFNGIIYGAQNPSPPKDYALQMIAYTIPIITLGLAVLGIARTLRSPRKYNIGLLALWAAAVPCLVTVSSQTPKFDGVRLFLSAFPFIALLAGIGGGVLVRIGAFFDKETRTFSFAKTVLVLLIIAMTINGGYALTSSRPNFLSYYNVLVKGTAGADAQGFETTYWGESLNKHEIENINHLLPDNASLTTRAMNFEVLRYYQQWGWLRKDIRLLEDRPADYHLVHYRVAFFNKMDAILVNDYQENLIDQVLGPDNVPLFGLYKTGPEFERFWRAK